MLKNLTDKTMLVLFAILLIASIAPAQQRAGSAPAKASQTAMQQQSDQATVTFRSARDLITEGRWSQAQDQFSDYITKYPNEKNLDAALYWMAYAQNKLGKFDLARATIDRLLEKYPNTSWKDDARVLLVQVPGTYVIAAQDLTNTLSRAAVAAPPGDAAVVYTPGAPLAPIAVAPYAIGQGIAVAQPAPVYTLDSLASGDENDPCEFKIVVLQALFQTDVQRGIVAATDWLKPGSTQTVRCKGAALTLLGRNGGKAVTPVILGVARNETDVKLRARAIAALGATNDDSVVDSLRDFALNSQDNEIVEASLYALSKHTGDRAIAVLGDIAVSGKTIAQRRMAIASVSVRPGEPAVDTLFRIYDADQSVEIRKAVIIGFANRKSERAGNRLMEIARSSDNVELRKVAVAAVSRRGGDKVVEFLLSLYDTEKNEEIKDQILSALGYGSAIYVGTPVAAGRREGQGIGVGVGQAGGFPAIAGTSRMNDERVVRKLIEIAKNPKEPMERRRRAIGWLSRSKDPQVLPFLEELLKANQ